MTSECARLTTKEEARFRIDYPNSTPRRTKIIALDKPAERLIQRLVRNSWNSAVFMTAAKDDRQHSAQGCLKSLADETLVLLEQVREADHVVTISSAGQASENSAIIAEACNLHRVMMTALVIDTASANEPSLLATLQPLRAHAGMLVVAKGEEYVEAMLTAMRA